MPDNFDKREKIVAGEWTIARVKNSLPRESREYHEAYFSENRRNIFYTRVAEIQNLIIVKPANKLTYSDISGIL